MESVSEAITADVMKIFDETVVEKTVVQSNKTEITQKSIGMGDFSFLIGIALFFIFFYVMYKMVAGGSSRRRRSYR